MLKFTPLFDWALPPEKEKWEPRREDPNVLRWIRRDRLKEACFPWRWAHEVGYVVRSPIEVELSPFSDLELEGGLAVEELTEVAKLAGLNQIWKRDKSIIGVRGGHWLRLFNFHNGEDWQGFFLPNGKGSVEFQLGFSLEAESVYLLVLPYWEEQEHFIVHHGLLDPKRLGRFKGFSAAFTPKQHYTLKRGEPFARLIPLTRESFNL